ncbi:MAG: HD domain-containing protein [Verrucomicrobiae bacterium]|nr:HD domain-containing protein [Verrucomicrobiae bacterium]
MQQKALPALSRLSLKQLSPLLETYLEVQHLKQLYRQGWLQNGLKKEICESVAEHSFAAAILALFLADNYFPQLDLKKVLIMVLLHDFGEIYAGDLTPVNNLQAEEKYHREQQSIHQVLAKLPQGQKYIALWEEFEKGESPEAQFIKQIDKLEMGLQAHLYETLSQEHRTLFTQAADEAVKDAELKAIFEEMKKATL